MSSDLKSAFTFLKDVDAPNISYPTAYRQLCKKQKEKSMKIHQYATEIAEIAFQFTEKYREIVK